MLTIFSPPKAFKGHINVIQRNAILSWLDLDENVEIFLVGNESGIREVAEEYGVKQIPDVVRNDLGTPLVSSIFQLAGENASYSTMCYVNADIIFMDDFVPAVRRVGAQFEKFLMIGQRWDMAITESIPFGEDWHNTLRVDLEDQGRLHPPAGSDYFVFKRGTFDNIPPFALGRAGWDNWMIFSGRSRRIPVVDATQAVTIIHQDHDYAHLPGGQPHYRLPESDENVRLGGGQETIFTLSDADWIYSDGVCKRKPWGQRFTLRGMEASVISRFGVSKLSRVFRMIFHPVDTFRYYSKALSRRMNRSSEEETEIGKGRV